MRIDWMLVAYASLQVLNACVIYNLVKASKIKSRLGLGFAAFTIAATTTLTSVGPLGLILGLPSIAISAILLGNVMHPGGFWRPTLLFKPTKRLCNCPYHMQNRS